MKRIRLGEALVVHRRSEALTPEYYGHLKRELPKRTK